MTSNIAEVLKLAAKPVQYDNDERTWLEFRFKRENYLTLVDEKYVKLLHDAKSQPVTNLRAGSDETAVTIRTLSHTLYALLATLTTGRSLRLVQRVPNRNGFEVWRQFSWWNLVWIGKYGELEQIVNIPVTQIVEEIGEVNIPVTQIVEEITELNIPVTHIVEEFTELNILVPQIVEEIAEVSKSSIEWRSIPNLYFEGIKVFLG